jgi:uncharacterized membrane protein HdeD (DUF308 family)
MKNVSFFDEVKGRLRAGLAEIDRKRGWYIALGVLLIVLGVIASSAAVATTLISVMALGTILLVAGIGLTVLSFLTGNWSGFLLTLATGILSLIAGFGLLSHPLAGAVVVTATIGMLLMVAGIYRVAASLVMRFPNWGWAVVSGLITLALGSMLIYGWQSTALWFIGLAVGIDLIVHGFSWIMFSSGVHHAAQDLGIVTPRERRAA